VTATMNATELTAALVQRGLLPAGSAAAHVPAARPWFIAAVLGAAGWLAGLFALFFVYLLVEPETAVEFAVPGAILLGAAYGLYFADRGNAFLDQLALAASIAGQLSLCIAAAKLTDSIAATAGLMTLVELALLFALPNPMARTLAAFFACIAWAIAVRFTWWDRAWWDGDAEGVALRPALLGWFVIWAPVIAISETLLRREIDWLATPVRPTARAASSGLIAALAVATWASEPFAGLTFVIGVSAPPTNWLALWPLLGAGAALYAAFCAFRLRARALLGLAIAGALLHTLQFYYVLGASLVVKSGIMLAVGALLLAVDGALRRRAAPPAGGER